MENNTIEVMFESTNETSVDEKYMKKGPGSRIRSKVTPIKIRMAHAKTGKPFYKTYYVKGKKLNKYRKMQMEDIAKGVKQPRYLTYHDN